MRELSLATTPIFSECLVEMLNFVQLDKYCMFHYLLYYEYSRGVEHKRGKGATTPIFSNCLVYHVTFWPLHDHGEYFITHIY